MSLVNMKSANNHKESTLGSQIEREEYPYGLSINLGNEQMEKLGINALPKVGSEMMITAKCVVNHASSNQHEGNKEELSFTMQITDMSIGQTSDAQNEGRAAKLYGTESL